MHGGVTKNIGTKYAAKPGNLYSKFLSPQEQIEHDALELGNVDAELRLIRIRLARAMELERKDIAGELVPELATRVERDGGGESTVIAERHYHKIDYRSAINACLARIESLEKTRMELSKAGSGGNEDVAAQLRSLADKLPV